jgi:hypothetical protein
MHTQATSALTLQFLTWVAAAPRTYGEAMEAWRTTCPRLTVWEDAVSEGLVRVEANGPKNDCKVSVTARGRQVLTAQTTSICAEPSQASVRRARSRAG